VLSRREVLEPESWDEPGCYDSSPRELMSNLAKVVAQLRQQRQEAQKKVDQADRALAALGA